METQECSYEKGNKCAVCGANLNIITSCPSATEEDCIMDQLY